MLLSVVSVLVVAQSSSEIPEGLMNNPVVTYIRIRGMLDHTGELVVVTRRENWPLLIVEAGTQNDTTFSCHNSLLSLYILQSFSVCNFCVTNIAVN